MWSAKPKKFGETFMQPNKFDGTEKVEYGFVSDNSYVNASDPNSILDRKNEPRSV